MRKLEVQPMKQPTLMAVKLLKELTDCGLKESKDLVDHGGTADIIVHDPTNLITELEPTGCEVRIIE